MCKMTAMRILLLAACVALGQPPAGPAVAVTIDATVVDPQRRPIPGLPGSDFTVQLDGRPGRVIAVVYHGGGAPMRGAIGPSFDAVTAAPPIYRIVVEPPEGTAAGREFTVAVTVKRPGATVHAPPRVAAAAVAGVSGTPGPATSVSAAASPQARLRAAVMSGRPESGLPIAAGYTNRRDPDSGRLTLDVQFEVSGAATPPLESVVGFVTDRGGPMRTAAPEIETVDGRYRVNLSIPVAPGEHKIRFAASDAAGAVGAIEYPVTAQLRQFGPVSASDLLRWTIDANGRRPFHLTAVPPGISTIAAGLELYDSPGAVPPADLIVKIELAGRQNDAAPLIERLVTPEVRGRHLVADAEFPLERVGNGEYVLRATMMSGASVLGTATAPILLKR